MQRGKFDSIAPTFRLAFRSTVTSAYVATLLLFFVTQGWNVRYRLTRYTSVSAYYCFIDLTHYDMEMWEPDSGWDVDRDARARSLEDYLWIGNPVSRFSPGCYALYIPWWSVLLATTGGTFLTFRLTRRRKAGPGFPVAPSAA